MFCITLSLFYVENVILIDNASSYIGAQYNTPHSEETPEVTRIRVGKTQMGYNVHYLKLQETKVPTHRLTFAYL